MSNNDNRGLGAAFKNALTSDGVPFGSSAVQTFAVLPIAWSFGNLCQSPANLQYALFQLAAQQAATLLEENRSRRRAIFAKDVYQWN